MRTVQLMLTASAGILLPVGVLAHSDDEMFDGHMFGSGMWGGWMFMIIFWIIGLTLCILLIKWIAGQSKREGQRDKTPLEILKERYAKSEINDKEFEDKKRKLQ